MEFGVIGRIRCAGNLFAAGVGRLGIAIPLIADFLSLRGLRADSQGCLASFFHLKIHRLFGDLGCLGRCFCHAHLCALTPCSAARAHKLGFHLPAIQFQRNVTEDQFFLVITADLQSVKMLGCFFTFIGRFLIGTDQPPDDLIGMVCPGDEHRAFTDRHGFAGGMLGDLRLRNCLYHRILHGECHGLITPAIAGIVVGLDLNTVCTGFGHLTGQCHKRIEKLNFHTGGQLTAVAAVHDLAAGAEIIQLQIHLVSDGVMLCDGA